MIAAYIIKQYERAVVFNLGKVNDEARGPGLIFVVPFVQRIRRVSLRIVTMPIQSQGIITKDNVSIDVSAVAYYRVEDPIRSVGTHEVKVHLFTDVEPVLTVEVTSEAK